MKTLGAADSADALVDDLRWRRATNFAGGTRERRLIVAIADAASSRAANRPARCQRCRAASALGSGK
jgi:hypothetical protein